jgi:methyltransferase (TIGR00027 family)
MYSAKPGLSENDGICRLEPLFRLHIQIGQACRNKTEYVFCLSMLNDQPSRTAEYMALFRAVETAEPVGRRLFEDPYAIPLLSGKLKVLAEIARIPLLGRLVTTFLDFGWPYTRSSGVVRTRWIDDLVCEAIHAGAQQLVLLGAGFDSRAYRLNETKGLRIFEVDHPATQKAKRERLNSSLKDLPDEVHFVEVDFEKDNLELKLKEAGFNAEVPAVVLWEGVVSYLTESAVDANLVVLARLLAPQSRLILTYVHKGALDGSVTFRGSSRWKSWVRHSGEPFIFGFDPAALAETLERYGFLLESDVSTAEVASRYSAANGRMESGSDLYRVASMTRSGA